MTDVGQKRLPVLFIGHGTPLNAISDNTYTQAWARLGQTIHPRAILSISAHWYTRGTRVTAMQSPPTLYDFGYRNLRHLTYPAPGSPSLARRIANQLAPKPVIADQDWGLDHGTWSVLLKAYPAADIPVVQLSIDRLGSPRLHFELGRRLKGLRDKGVLIMATGNIVHNLDFIIRSGPARPYPWAERFDAIVRDKLVARAWNDLIDYQNLGDNTEYAVPTPDHYVPLLYALGAANVSEPLMFPVEGIDHGSMSMRCVQFGA